ncbi:MAG TPA: DUF429 domain-containing protein [Polyangiaceae bacterium]|nr:DUF429 domain-containing protein [Polyangiaceae bacterium]
MGEGSTAQQNAGRLAKGAISVLPLSGCSHWAITCASLGIPFGVDRGLKLAETLDDGDKLIIEVHPALTLARWWVYGDANGEMPKYKGIKKVDAAQAIATIKSGLNRIGIPVPPADDDDHLDAWVAWQMGADFIAGQAEWFGSPRAGGYVIPQVAKRKQ